jgi:O-antigen/teichoic acid export membrane protein
LGINTIATIIKLALPFLFVSLGSFGIISSFMIAVMIAMVLSILALRFYFGYVVRPELDVDIVKKVSKFSGINYFSSLLGTLPGSITPIIITNSLGPSITAFYYMPSMIIQVLLSIPRSQSSAFFTESVQVKDVSSRRLFFRSLKTMYGVLLPLSIVLMIAGKYILLVFGKQYTDAGYMYLLFVIASVNISAPNYLFSQLFNVKQKLKLIVLQSVLSCVYSLTTLLVFLPGGLYGIGIAAVVSSLLLLVTNSLISFYTFR